MITKGIYLIFDARGRLHTSLRDPVLKAGELKVKLLVHIDPAVFNFTTPTADMTLLPGDVDGLMNVSITGPFDTPQRRDQVLDELITNNFRRT